MNIRYRALACDYDGALAHDSVVEPATAAALDRFRAAGRKLIMVTGRELRDLKAVCPVLDRFDYVVAENGALLYCPEQDRSRLLCEPASEELVQVLRTANVRPLSVGQASDLPHQLLDVAPRRDPLSPDDVCEHDCRSDNRDEQRPEHRLLFPQTIAKPAHRLDELARLTELLAQPAHVRVHRARVNNALVAPHVVEQTIALLHSSAPLHQGA
jgi:hydroxymethylpyrimidine pyrophosphatase-like HAD family hydrolase